MGKNAAELLKGQRVSFGNIDGTIVGFSRIGGGTHASVLDAGNRTHLVPLRVLRKAHDPAAPGVPGTSPEVPGQAVAGVVRPKTALGKDMHTGMPIRSKKFKKDMGSDEGIVANNAGG